MINIRALIFLFTVGIGINSFAQQAQPKLVFPQQQLIEDFDSLCKTLEECHPYLFEQIPHKEYDKNKSNILNVLRAQDSMSVQDFYLLLAPFVASLKEGHSGIYIPISSRVQYLNNGGLAFPFKVHIADNRLFVFIDLSMEQNVEEGTEIISINGVPVSDILQRMFSLNGSERNDDIKYSGIEPYFSTLLWYMYHFEKDYNLVVKKDGTEQHVFIQGITQKHFSEVMEQKGKNTPEKKYSLDIDSVGKKATMMIRSFADTKALSAFLKPAFQDLSLNDVDSLVIDVRNNEGGNSGSVDFLMFYLTDKPYKQYDKIELKVSDAVKTVYKDRHPDLYNVIKDLPNGSIYTYPDEFLFTQTKENKWRFTKKITVLVNSKTYSAGSTFASVVECLNIGEVIGITGFPKISFADFLSFKLPNTQIDYYVAIKKFHDCSAE